METTDVSELLTIFTVSAKLPKATGLNVTTMQAVSDLVI
jgi:hypothetical protein